MISAIVGIVASTGTAIAGWIWAGIVVVTGAVDGAEAVAEAKVGVLEVVVGIAIALLTTLLGISLGIGFQLGFLNPLAIAAILATGLPFATIILYPYYWQRSRLIAKYRQSEQRLIKP